MKFKKNFPLSENNTSEAIDNFGSPLHLYFEEKIENQTKKLYDSFSWCLAGFCNYFAVKATPNPNILRLLYSLGHKMDCSSLTELHIMENIGIRGDSIMYTSNNTPDEEFIKANEMGAIINIDDYSHISSLKRLNIIPETICFRFLPDSDSNQDNIVIGSPKDSKFGIKEEDILKCFSELKDMGVKKFGLHTMQASNEKNEHFFIETAKKMFSLAKKISMEIDIDISFINLGGGLGINQHPDEKEIDIEYIGDEIKSLYFHNFFEDSKIIPKIFMENGRYITGPSGYLVTKVRHIASKHKTFVGVDACMADFMRPALYKDYHHISTFSDKENNVVYDVVGSLCENNDKFAIDRVLPEVERNDILIIHDTGAHGHAMGFNYNGKLKSPEILVKNNGAYKLIRRRETPEDLMATIV